jgi:AraC family transcriptional regulator
MSNLESMHQAVQFIEHHLKEPISVQDVADAAGYSLYHFSRTFNRVIGHSPYDYIMRRRLSESARELIESKQRIVDIALEYQFNNPETYTRAFRSMFGVPPNQARKNKSLSNLIFKSRITFEYIQHINQGDYLKPKFVERGAIHLVGMASLVKDQAEVRAELQEKLVHEVETIAHRVRPERYYGASFFTQTWEMEGFFYLAGVEVTSLETIPPVLVGKTIPPSKYARFIHKGPSQNVGMTFDYIYQTWLPKSGNTLAAPLEIEFYGERYRGPDDSDSESEILIPIC